MQRKPNSQECAYYGRKLSNVATDDIQCRDRDCYVVIGSDRDDEIYFSTEKGDFLPKYEDMLKERVKLYVFSECMSKEYDNEIDLEDLLKFCAVNCTELYERVLSDKRVEEVLNNAA